MRPGVFILKILHFFFVAGSLEPGVFRSPDLACFGHDGNAVVFHDEFNGKVKARGVLQGFKPDAALGAHIACEEVNSRRIRIRGLSRMLHFNAERGSGCDACQTAYDAGTENSVFGKTKRDAATLLDRLLDLFAGHALQQAMQVTGPIGINIILRANFGKNLNQLFFASRAQVDRSSDGSLGVDVSDLLLEVDQVTGCQTRARVRHGHGKELASEPSTRKTKFTTNHGTMHESNGCVAVIIPSRNRAHWVKKRLSAYARNPDGIHIYLADSSDRADRAVLERESKYWADQGLRLNYAWSQPQGPLPAIAQALDQVSQSWITFCGDDDQQLEFSLARATRFLEQNPDCVAAHGQGVLFELNSRDQPVGFSLYGVTDCSGPAHLISNYYCPLFLVSRADAFKKSIQVGLKLKHQIFRQELGASIALALQGRLAHIPGAGFIRQTHQSHFALTADPTLFDLVFGILLSRNSKPRYSMRWEKV